MSFGTLRSSAERPDDREDPLFALIQGSSELDAFLRERGIDTWIITGCLADMCCESTARNAMMLNYNAITVIDLLS